MPVQDLVQHFRSRNRMIYPVNVLIRISVVVMVFQRQIPPRNPAYVQERVTPYLDYSAAADAPGMVRLFHFQNRIPMAVYQPRQHPTVWVDQIEIQSIGARRIRE